MNKLPHFIGILIIIVLDQLSKWYVLEEMLLQKAYAHKQPRDFFTWILEVKNSYLPPVSVEMVPDLLNFTMVWNRGISFGLLQQTGHGVLILIGLTSVIVFGLTIWMCRNEDKNLGAGLVMVIGGAIGNIIDRARFEAVIDFVDIYFGEWHYPAFNFADSCIVLGVLLLMINIIQAQSAQKEQFSHKI